MLDLVEINLMMLSKSLLCQNNYSNTRKGKEGELTLINRVLELCLGSLQEWFLERILDMPDPDSTTDQRFYFLRVYKYSLQR